MEFYFLASWQNCEPSTHPIRTQPEPVQVRFLPSVNLPIAIPPPTAHTWPPHVVYPCATISVGVSVVQVTARWRVISVVRGGDAENVI